jgi:hypothetical protein
MNTWTILALCAASFSVGVMAGHTREDAAVGLSVISGIFAFVTFIVRITIFCCGL